MNSRLGCEAIRGSVMAGRSWRNRYLSDGSRVEMRSGARDGRATICKLNDVGSSRMIGEDRVINMSR